MILELGLTLIEEVALVDDVVKLVDSDEDDDSVSSSSVKTWKKSRFKGESKSFS